MSDTERDPPDTVVMKEAFDHTAITTYSHPPQRSSYPFPPLPKHDEAAERMSEASASQQVGPLALPSPQPTTEAEAAAEAELKLQAAERAEDLNLPPRQKVNKPLRVPRSRQNVGNAPGPSAGAGAGAAENGQRKHRQLMAEQVELAAKLRDEANRYLQEEKFVQAVEMYSEAVKVLPKLAPETAICLANRSAAWLALGDFQRAVEDAEQAVRFDCMYFKAHFRLGKALRALADEQSANNAQKPQGGILDSNVAASTGSNEAHAFDAMREAAEQSLSLAKILKKNAASDAAAKKLASYWARVVHERGSIKGLYSMRAKKSHFEMSEEPIGVGNFAKIYTARHKVTREKFALKVISKEGLKRTRIRHKNVDNEIFMEKRVLRRLVGQRYIVQLYNTFQDASHLYFLMDYCPGGEMWGLFLQNGDNQAGLLPVKAAFFAAQLVQALGCLRQEGIVHRDLKPENIMLSADRTQIQLIDFGTAKDLQNTDLNGPEHVGTPEYMPPEAVKGLASDCDADLWSFGNIVFQLLHGRPPFRAGSDYLTMQHALHVIFLFLPRTYDEAGKDLVEKLLQLEPHHRLGAVPAGEKLGSAAATASWDTLRNHPFFACTNLASLRNASDQVRMVTEESQAGTNASESNQSRGERLLRIDAELSKGRFSGEKVAQLSAADRQWLFDRLVSTNYLFFIPQTFPKFCKSRAARQFAFVHSHEWLQRTQKTQGEFQGPFSIAHVDTRALKGVARAALDARLAELADGYLQLVVVTGPLLDDTGRVPDSICSTLGSVANTSVTAAAEDGVVDLDLTDTVTDDVPPPPLLCATDTAVLDSLSPFNDENDVDVDYSRLYYGVWNGGTRTFVLSSELLLLPEHGGSAHRARHAGYQRRWLKFQLHLALLTAEQTMLVLDDPILSPNSSPLMREAGPEAVSELQHWLLDLIAEFNVGAVFMSDRGGSEDLEQAAQLFDALLEEKGFSRSTPVESSKQRIATFRYTMTEDTQRHANGTPCTLSLLRSSADAVGTVKVHLKNLEVSALSLA
eukprot:INCI5916.3.p1 GENE.INCI5916.3~~INCI5916.3.p1  ORF type:complete len:1060 (+),score=203.53 INCI5916.3:100-3180(+)